MIDAQVIPFFLSLLQMLFIFNQVLESPVLSGPESSYCCCFADKKSIVIFF